jgi:hypothetical protein
MRLLADAGIYVALDVGTRNTSLNNANQDTMRLSYNDDYTQRIFSTVEQFSKYDNTLVFFSGNEVVYFKNQTWTAPYIKSVVRDIKQYQRSRGLRQVPVGYAAADHIENVFELGSFLNCGDNATARSDFFAINDYSWCNPSNFETSGWNKKVEKWQGYGIPLLYVTQVQVETELTRTLAYLNMDVSNRIDHLISWPVSIVAT